MIKNIPCVILAGGKSSRMGEDKSLLPFPPYKTLTHYQYQRLNKIFKNVYISSKDSSKLASDFLIFISTRVYLYNMSLK